MCVSADEITTVERDPVVLLYCAKCGCHYVVPAIGVAPCDFEHGAFLRVVPHLPPARPTTSAK
jgi:hypothetical protein